MKLCVLGSGSSGNAVLMQAGTTRILLDAGFGTRTIARRLLAIGVDPRSIEAVVVTHEHTDHSRGASAGAARWGWQIYATPGTIAACLPLAEAGARTIGSGGAVTIGDIGIEAIATSHDADEPVAVIATGSATGTRAAIVYDLGLMTGRLQKAMEGVEILVLESNHDGDMLRNGPYPAMLKRRIAGHHGHLSNKAAGVAAARCAHPGLAHVVLAHLSETNNTPGIATASMKSALARTSFRGTIAASRQDAPSRPVSAAKRTSFVAVQLALGL